MGEICHPRCVPDICICCAVKGLKTNHDYLVESMESKSQKEIQVEEVLIPKIQSSPAKSLLELYAGVEGEEMKQYM